MTVVEDTPVTRKSRKKMVFQRFNAHAKRAFRLIEKIKLTVPHDEYQRDESGGKIAKSIAMYFDEVAFGSLTVIQRESGELVVVDGGTRLAAALLRDDIDQVPCMVYSGLTDQEEALVFLRINMTRKKLQTHQQHQAEVFAKIEHALRAQAILDDFARDRIGFQGKKEIRDSVRVYPEAAQSIVNVLHAVAVDKFVSVRVFKGMMALEVNLNKADDTLNKKSTLRKIHENFGGLDYAIVGNTTGAKRGTRLMYGQAVAKVLRIRWRSDK